MGLQDYLAFIEKSLEIEAVKKVSGNGYILEHPERTFKLYQQGKQVFLEGSIGPSLRDTPETNAMLAELLQFNLKRTQFLDNIIFLDKDTHQLFLREILPGKEIPTEELKARLEDFVLNIEVFEDRFFPKAMVN